MNGRMVWRESSNRRSRPLQRNCLPPTAPRWPAFARSTARAPIPARPGFCRHVMRPDDRLIAAELHPPTYQKLVEAIGMDKRCKALAIDGWTALGPMSRRRNAAASS